MLIKLSGRGLRALGPVSDRPFVARVREHPTSSTPENELLVVTDVGVPLSDAFRGYLHRQQPPAHQAPRDSYVLGTDFSYLADGDVVRIDPQRNSIHALYRRSSPFNSLLVTERCDNYCVMCSQPPKDRDDSWIVAELKQAIPLMSPETPEIGITGGEPSLLGPQLIELVELLKVCLPKTSVHILTNGRSFANEAFAQALADVHHPDLMLGIPLYSDLPEVHDYVVQARGAYDQTIRGILNLKQAGVAVELRFVIHRDTYEGLPAFARFVTRNLLFVDHVALMGLEPTGFALANLDAIWIDPLDYANELTQAALTLDRAGLRTSIYNHQLCVLPVELHRFARASISDWKNMYLDACDGCSLRSSCGGFFASAAKRCSRGIAAVRIG